MIPHIPVIGCHFNYGIHAYSLLHGLLGPGMESIRFLGSHIQKLVEVAWKDGRTGQVLIGKTAGYLPMYATVVTEMDVSHFAVEKKGTVRGTIGCYIALYGREAHTPLPLFRLLEVEMAAMAAQLSWQSGGNRVFLTDIP